MTSVPAAGCATGAAASTAPGQRSAWADFGLLVADAAIKIGVKKWGSDAPKEEVKTKETNQERPIQ